MAEQPGDHARGQLDAATVEAMLRHRLRELLGGWRGAAETALPTVAFVLAWMASHDVRTAVVASGIGVVVLVAMRLVQRQTVRYALSSVMTTAVAAILALRTGQAEAAFLPGIAWNVALTLAAVVSVLTRWPLLGFIVAAADPAAASDPGVFTRWRSHPGVVRVCQRLTIVLAVLFAVRVAVMVPLYLAAEVGWLGVAKLVLSWPAYLAALAVMGWMLVRGRTPLDPERPIAGG